MDIFYQKEETGNGQVYFKQTWSPIGTGFPNATNQNEQAVDWLQIVVPEGVEAITIVTNEKGVDVAHDFGAYPYPEDSAYQVRGRYPVYQDVIEAIGFDRPARILFALTPSFMDTEEEGEEPEPKIIEAEFVLPEWLRKDILPEPLPEHDLSMPAMYLKVEAEP